MACSFSALHFQNTGMITEQCDKIHLFHPLSKILLHSIILFLPFLSPLALSLSPSYLQLGERLKVEDSGYRGHVKRGEKKGRKWNESICFHPQHSGEELSHVNHTDSQLPHTRTDAQTHMSYSGINPHSSSQSHCLTHIEESNSRSQTRMTSSLHRELYTSSGMPCVKCSAKSTLKSALSLDHLTYCGWVYMCVSVC